jgi:hypothetical protein
MRRTKSAIREAILATAKELRKGGGNVSGYGPTIFVNIPAPIQCVTPWVIRPVKPVLAYRFAVNGGRTYDDDGQVIRGLWPSDIVSHVHKQLT